MIERLIKSLACRVVVTVVGMLVACVAIAGASPTSAMASGLGRIHVKQTMSDESILPPSTIMVYDTTNVVVGKSTNENGLTEFDLPTDLTSKLTPNKTYTVTAMADGYSFTSKTGVFAEDRDYTIDLVGTRTITVHVQLQAEGVTDYSYVRAALYEGNNVSTTPKSTVSPSKQGSIEFTNVPVGANYTIMLTCPSNLAGQLPELHRFSVDKGQMETQEVIIQGTAAILEAENPVVTEVPEPIQKYEAPVPTQQEQEQAQRPLSTQPIAQTGDAVLIVTLSVIGVALLAIVVLVVRRK